MGVNHSRSPGIYGFSDTTCHRVPLVGPGLHCYSNVRLREEAEKEGERGREGERERERGRERVRKSAYVYSLFGPLEDKKKRIIHV